VSPLELVDDRFEKLASELRGSKPVASAELRERVASLRAAEPAGPRWTLRLPTRRVALGLVAAAVLASFVIAGVTGLNGSDEKRVTSLGRQLAPRTTDHQSPALGLAPATTDHASTAQGLKRIAPALGAAELAPNTKRLQRYEATLRLRVKNVDALSNAARRAMNLTRSLGGYVASVNYATRGGKRGGATLVLRVPVANVQTELVELTSFGTILRQQTGILDVTRRADREAKQIANLQRALATATPEGAVWIRHRLATLRAKHARLLKSARFARITLGLTTPAKQAAPAPSRFERTLDDAGAVLLRELEILLYAGVVAGPLLLLGGAAVAASRAARRRWDRRLLERA
jgi:hypothetical protein